MNTMLLLVTLMVGCFVACQGFSTTFRAGPLRNANIRVVKNNGARSMTAFFDVLAGLSLAAQLNSAPINIQPRFMDQSMALSVVETKQGMFKEYSVDTDKEADAKLDAIRKTYKSADETDEGKGKYWAIFAVLIVGSFTIPMAQYYWYVAEEADDE